MNRPVLFDTHAHLQLEDFDGDREDTIQRAREVGVGFILNIGIDLEASRRALALAEADEGFYAAVGVHPHAAAAADDATWRAVAELARHPKAIAIGETGLDFYRNLSPREVQEAVFRRHVRLARELGKPVLIHDREAHEAVLAILKEEKAPEVGGIMHCFSGDAAFAEQCLALGFYISIAGPVTYPNARKLPDVVRAVPLGRLVVETDCPYLPPHPYRGKRNEPGYLVLTAQRVAELKGLGYEELVEATAANTCRLFTVPRLKLFCNAG